MKSTMNKGDVAKMNKLAENGMKDSDISKVLGVDTKTMDRFRPKKVVPKIPKVADK